VISIDHDILSTYYFALHIDNRSRFILREGCRRLHASGASVPLFLKSILFYIMLKQCFSTEKKPFSAACLFDITRRRIYIILLLLLLLSQRRALSQHGTSTRDFTACIRRRQQITHRKRIIYVHHDDKPMGDDL